LKAGPRHTTLGDADMTEEKGSDQFSAYEVIVQDGNPNSPDSMHAYLIESTAPDNIDDNDKTTTLMITRSIKSS